MSEKHETIVRRLVDEVWNKGNLKVLDECCLPDVVNHDPMNQVRGIEAAKGLVRKYRTAFPDVRLEIDEMLSTNDRVVIRWRFSGTHHGQLENIAPTGRRVQGQGITLYHFMGDRVQELFVNWDALGMLQQLGVVTLPGRAAQSGA